MRPPPRFLRRAPIVREPLRRLYKRLAPNTAVRKTIDGVTFDLVPADNKTDFDLWYKSRLEEAQERAFLADHLSAGDVFVDIGANIGLYTAALLRAVPGVSAVAFEPLPHLRKRLAANLELNGVSHRAAIRGHAVGPEGAFTLYQSRNAGRSSLLPFSDAHSEITVPVRPLADALRDEKVVPAAIKIDVEGFEDRALLPYFAATPPTQWPKALVIETLHRGVWQRDCLSTLTEIDYWLVAETPENALFVRKSIEAE